MATPHEDAAGIKVEEGKYSRGRKCSTCGLHVPTTLDTCPNDGTQLAKKLAAGDLIFGRYEFIEVIGEGGMGVVYKARHPDLKRLYAIKLLHSHLAGINAANRFVQEARAASALSHQNIITVHDYSSDPDGRQYIVMDYLEGADLQSRIDATGGLPVNEVIDLFLQICDGLAHAHKKGVVHRDLKPSNIMLCANDQGEIMPKIVDFGLAKVVAEEGSADSGSSGPALTRTGDVLGSPPYMSPEQCKGMQLDARTDIYSLGCMMFEALTGRIPFMASSTMAIIFKHMEEPPPSLASAKPDASFPPGLEAIVAKCLEKRRPDRYQTVEELQQALEAVRRGKHLMTPSQKRMLVAGGATMCGALLLALGFYLFNPADPHLPMSKKPKQRVDQEVLQESINSYFDQPLYEQFKCDKKLCTDSWMPTVAKRDTLKRLIISHSAVTDNGVKAFENSSARITEIDFDDQQQIGDESMKVMSRFPLKDVHIQQTDVGDDGLKYLADGPSGKTIEDIEMARVYVTDKGIQALVAMPSLVTLDLTQIPNFNPSWLSVIAKMTQLRDLDVEGDPVGSQLSALAPMKNLRGLRMRSIPGHEPFVRYLPIMPALKGLDLAANETELEPEDFAAIAKQPKLEFLNLGKCKFNPADLANLKASKTLARIVLTESDATADSVMALKGMHTLQMINIERCSNISTEEAVAINEAMAPVEIQYRKPKDFD